MSDFRRPNKDLLFSEAIAINDPRLPPASLSYFGLKLYSWRLKGNLELARSTVMGVSGYWLYITSRGIFTEPIATFVPFEADILWIPDGDSFLIVKDCNGAFTVTREIAAALANQPPGKNAWIRFATEARGGPHLRQIGKEPVKAWKKIYANWTQSQGLSIEDLGF